ncbi:tRNA dimethylallyltransferase [Vibrio maritimus]|uniref:tRNA dimethylallyltransferase n=1 Tax=Vibrio maritimus TaxID=990268 RepID=A0A090SAL7_9VIBR|nr:tRNA dimethylallyltransferase [Vibrio maritimus]
MNQQLPLVLFLMGPTASGKTELAIRLRQQYLWRSSASILR